MTFNKTLANIIFGGLLLSLFIPFIVANGMFFPFITGKGFVFRIGIEVLFMLWVVLAIRDRSYLPKFSWILGTLLIFLAAIGLADFFGVYPYKSFWSNYERMDGYITLIHLLMYFLVTSAVLTTQKWWNIFFGTSVGASVIMCIYGFFQLGGAIAINQGGVRLDGTLGNAIYLAVYMLFNLFFVAHLAMRVEWSRLAKYLVFVPIALMQLIILYYTATRGVILGLIGGVFLAALLIIVFERHNKSLRRHAMVGIVALVVLIGAFIAVRNTDFVAHSQTLSRFSSLSPDSIKTQGRYFIWPMALKGFKDHPVLGWGQESFNYVFNKYYDARMYNQEAWFDRTHNIFLDWLVAGGVLGLGSYLALLAALLVLIWHTSWTMKEKSLLTGLVAAYIFQNIFAFDNITSYLLFFSILAFVHVDVTRNRAPVRALDRFIEKVFHTGDAHNQKTYQGIGIAVIGVVFCAVLYLGNVKAIAANYELIGAIDPGRSTAQQSIQHFKNAISYDSFGTAEAREQFYVLLPQFQRAGIPAEVQAAYVALGREQLTKQVERTPNDARYLLFLGGFLNRVRDFTGAMPYLERGIEVSPQKQAILFELAVSHINLGQYKEALALFKTAFDYAPAYEEARIFYGLGALYVGDDKLANELFTPIDRNTFYKDDRFLNAYSNLGQWNKAVDFLKHRVALDEGNIQARFSLAAAYLKVGDRFSAIAQLQKAKEIEPKVQEQVDFYISEIRAGRTPQ